ncbi:MAG TPA: tetratricopeptide repeat protein [Pyrinomonadaceae bacterium]|nr:tetratricopeptide repeat protein [Pyrinomonadaceae bacterium]
MHTRINLARRGVPAALLVAALSLALATPAHARRQDGDADERRRAVELLQQGNAVAALPLLEKLSAANPSDGQLMFFLGYAVLGQAKILKEAEARKAARLRARGLMLKAQEMGYDDPLLRSVLESIPPGGGHDEVFSQNPQADAAMRDAEAAFVQGKFDDAIASYQTALGHDPQLYDAALFTGDMYTRKNEFDKAAEWYARAVQIDPDRETAYRYSATPLMRQRRYDEAKARYVEAVIAEPYNRLTWVGLGQWARAAGVQLAHPKVEIPAGFSAEGGKMTINLDPKLSMKEDGTAAWVTYGLTRSLWHTQKFAKEFPAEKAYRHTLREEAEALRSVVTSAKEQQKEGKVKTLDPNLARLVRLHEEGLLEAYVLLARPDPGIAQDYAAYRKANRDKLRRYLVEYVTAGGRP